MDLTGALKVAESLWSDPMAWKLPADANWYQFGRGLDSFAPCLRLPGVLAKLGDRNVALVSKRGDFE